jgi:hypothetical protein
VFSVAAVQGMRSQSHLAPLPTVGWVWPSEAAGRDPGKQRQAVSTRSGDATPFQAMSLLSE